MTIPSLTCETFADRLADLLEHDVDDATRVRLEAHARSCGDCGPLLADLRALRDDAAALPELAPSRDLWSGIAERIETPIVALAAPGAAQRSVGKPRRLAPLWYGLAAAGLVAVTATVTHEMTRRSMTGGTTTPAETRTLALVQPATPDTATRTPAGAATPAAATKNAAPLVRQPSVGTAGTTRLVSSRPSAEETYDNEIARLRKVVNSRRGQLDSTTIATVESNLVVIDRAIAQCKQALRKDPASRFLIESLNDAMDSKVQLLRTAASLPSAM